MKANQLYSITLKIIGVYLIAISIIDLIEYAVAWLTWEEPAYGELMITDGDSFSFLTSLYFYMIPVAIFKIGVGTLLIFFSELVISKIRPLKGIDSIIPMALTSVELMRLALIVISMLTLIQFLPVLIVELVERSGIFKNVMVKANLQHIALKNDTIEYLLKVLMASLVIYKSKAFSRWLMRDRASEDVNV